jgi:hypothetical protein
VGSTGQIGQTGPTGSFSSQQVANISQTYSTLTQQLTPVIYNTSTRISSSNIISQLDSSLNLPQVYTFGNSIPNRWVAGGQGTNTIAYSDDGINWTGLGTTIFNFSVQDISWNGTMWVAVSFDSLNTIAYSYNGINWTGIGTTIFSTAGRGIGWNGTMWVAGGQGINTIAYSYNGINWTGL